LFYCPGSSVHAVAQTAQQREAHVADLQYSLQLLTGLGRELTALADAVEGSAPGTRWNADEVGHHRVVDALHDFAGNWDDNRAELTKSLRAVGKMATDSAETFRQVDDELAGEIEGIVQGGR